MTDTEKLEAIKRYMVAENKRLATYATVTIKKHHGDSYKGSGECKSCNGLEYLCHEFGRVKFVVLGIIKGDT